MTAHIPMAASRLRLDPHAIRRGERFARSLVEASELMRANARELQRRAGNHPETDTARAGRGAAGLPEEEKGFLKVTRTTVVRESLALATSRAPHGERRREDGPPGAAANAAAASKAHFAASAGGGASADLDAELRAAIDGDVLAGDAMGSATAGGGYGGAGARAPLHADKAAKAGSPALTQVGGVARAPSSLSP